MRNCLRRLSKKSSRLSSIISSFSCLNFCSSLFSISIRCSSCNNYVDEILSKDIPCTYFSMINIWSCVNLCVNIWRKKAWSGVKNCFHSYSSCRSKWLKNPLALQQNLLERRTLKKRKQKYAVPITLNHFTPRKPLNIENAVTVKWMSVKLSSNC